jgi:hypothetical protein
MFMQVVHIFEHIAFHGSRDGNVIDQAFGRSPKTPQRLGEWRTSKQPSPQVNHIFTEPNATGMWTDRHSKPKNLINSAKEEEGLA